jgi:anthranilate phosphoribosyltransferase
MVETMIDAADFGFPDEVDLAAPIDPNVHADAIRAAFEGKPSAAANQIALTAAVLLWMVERVPDIQSGLTIAQEQLTNGNALAVLNRVKQLA